MSHHRLIMAQIRKFTHKTQKSVLSVTLLAVLAATTPLLAAGGRASNGSEQGHDAQEHSERGYDVPSKLVEIVRDATRMFHSPDALSGTDYAPAFGCVTGPDHGAMGVHYISMPLVGDNEIDAMKPEALIYEPAKNGSRLVGVEYIVDYAAWMANHPAPPMLEGQAFQIVGSPNRYGLPPFFELHVWAWRENPNGAFVDWNDHVSCEHQ
jgi:hypothetical protein